MIEKWKDTAFGSDFGGDFLELVEEISQDKELSFDLIYSKTDLKKYLDEPSLLELRTDNNVNFVDSPFNQYIHFEDAIIALAAMIVESGTESGRLDLREAYETRSFNLLLVKMKFDPSFLL